MQGSRARAAFAGRELRNEKAQAAAKGGSGFDAALGNNP